MQDMLCMFPLSLITRLQSCRCCLRPSILTPSQVRMHLCLETRDSARAWWVKQCSSARESSRVTNPRMWPMASTATPGSGWHAAETRCADSAAHSRPQISRMRPRLSVAASIMRASVYVLRSRALVELQSLHAHGPVLLRCLAVTDFETVLLRAADHVHGSEHMRLLVMQAEEGRRLLAVSQQAQRERSKCMPGGHASMPLSLPVSRVCEPS